jgi:hypothetical protein
MSVLTKLRLPHPYLTYYTVRESDQSRDGVKLAKVQRGDTGDSTSKLKEIEPPLALHNDTLLFSPVQYVKVDDITEGDNTPWARARRSAFSIITWSSRPSPGQIWLVAYALYTLRPDLESIRITLEGPENELVRKDILGAILGIEHPKNEKTGDASVELLFLRTTFWQGAGSPFGEGSVWIPKDASRPTRSLFLDYTMTTKFPQERVHTWHPRRPEKPTPGSVIYSRYLPHLDEVFSMVAIDYQNEEHLRLFHVWQNDPRVAKGWNETGTLEQHREYLLKQHNDPHQLTMFAIFEGTPFAYFEVYWAKVITTTDLRITRSIC